MKSAANQGTRRCRSWAWPMALLLLAACNENHKADLVTGKPVNSGAQLTTPQDADKRLAAERQRQNDATRERQAAEQARSKADYEAFQKAQATCAAAYDENAEKAEKMLAFMDNGKGKYRIVPIQFCLEDQQSPITKTSEDNQGKDTPEVNAGDAKEKKTAESTPSTPATPAAS